MRNGGLVMALSHGLIISSSTNLVNHLVVLIQGQADLFYEGRVCHLVAIGGGFEGPRFCSEADFDISLSGSLI